jgi:hypothetical protein
MKTVTLRESTFDEIFKEILEKLELVKMREKHMRPASSELDFERMHRNSNSKKD